MDKICLQCDNVGCETELVFCTKCSNSAMHSSCMVKTDDELFSWICDGCKEKKLLNQSSVQSSSMAGKNLGLNSSRKKLKKNRRKRKGKKFLNSLAGVEGQNHHVSVSTVKEFDSKKNGAVKEENYHLSYVESTASDVYDTLTEPRIVSVWTGDFQVRYSECTYRTMHGFRAHLSSKACQKVYNEAIRFQPLLKLEMLPKSCVWPKSFCESCPTNNIALYFFPSLMEHERIYDYLVYEMIRHDLAMRAFTENAELLIFTSIVLPPQYWRFQGKMYLWGVFKGKKVTSTLHTM